MKSLDKRLAALEAQRLHDPLVVAVGETDDPTNPRCPYRILREYVIDPAQPFDYDQAIVMIAAEESV
jgi:hypothetical protein